LLNIVRKLESGMWHMPPTTIFSVAEILEAVEIGPCCRVGRRMPVRTGRPGKRPARWMGRMRAAKKKKRKKKKKKKKQTVTPKTTNFGACVRAKNSVLEPSDQQHSENSSAAPSIVPRGYKLAARFLRSPASVSLDPSSVSARDFYSRSS